MTLELKNPEEIRKFINHIDKNKDNPTLDKILSNKSTFVKEIQDFYGVKDTSTHGRAGTESYDMKKEVDKEKTLPKNLISLLNGFEKEPINIEFLDYERVREDVKHFNKYSNRYYAMTIGTLLGGIILGTTIAFINGKLGVTVGAGGVVIGIGRSIYERFKQIRCASKGLNRPGDKPGKIAFVKLRSAGSSADYFIQDYNMLKEKELI